jgi:hypothetical protein
MESLIPQYIVTDFKKKIGLQPITSTHLPCFYGRKEAMSAVFVLKRLNKLMIILFSKT